MKSLKESILSDMDDVISRGESDLENAYKIPNVSEFYKDFDKQYAVDWACPLLFDKYKNKFKSIQLQHGELNNLRGIQFKLYGASSTRPFVHMYFMSDRYRIVVKGWTWTLKTSGLRAQKQEIIEGIKKIANNLDEIMDHSYMCYNLNPAAYVTSSKYIKYIDDLK